MRVYWDSSALINALAARAVLARLDQGEHVTRSHAYVEAFHHLSGRGLPLKDGTRVYVKPADAAAMIRKLAGKIHARDLDAEQTLQALEDAQSRGVMGRMVHDWMHTRAAKLAQVDLIVARDDDFVRLSQAEGLTTDWP